MSAAKLNLKIDVNAQYHKVITYKNAAGTRQSLAGWTAHMQIRTRVGGAVLIELTTENFMLRLEAEPDEGASTVGVITILIPSTVTDNVIVTTGTYDLLLIPPSGIDDSIRLCGGTVTFSPAVTLEGDE